MRSISILHISHISNYTPPVGYGGTELIVDLLAKHQRRKGYDVKVLGVKPLDVNTDYPIIPLFSKPVKKPRLHHKLYTMLRSLINSLHVEVVHVHVQWVASSLAFLKLLDKAVLLTLHADLSISLANRILKALKMPLVAISYTQKERLEGRGFKIFDVAYHGIKVDKYPFSKNKEDYLVYLGRIDSSKGVHVAVRVSKRAGERLILMGPVTDRAYFDSLIRPFVDGKNIIYPGEVDFETKVKVLSRARALIYPVQYEEFFGLAMVEALACGTPVLGFAKGSVREIVKNGVTGFLVNNEDEMVETLKKLHIIDPLACRMDVEKRFSAENMAKRYEEIYEKLLGSVRR
ncbi:MAG: glycosyltransferase [Candidatus Korarchaeota archaeon]|nr:glycosyltransferase [Thermoproteota archaeon]